MKPSSSEHDPQDEELIKRLHDLGSVEPVYPPDLLTARRDAFVAQIDRLRSAEAKEELDPRDQEIVRLLGELKAAEVEYPAGLLAARRSAFLQQIERVGTISLWDQLRLSIQRIFQYKVVIPTLPSARRTSLVVAVLMVAALIGSLLFTRTGPTFSPAPSPAVVEPTGFPPTTSPETALIVCKPDDQAPLCSPRELDSSPDLAEQGNGAARPAVSSEAGSSEGAAQRAAYVNDGRSDTSWVSSSPDSWIKIDLGKVRTLNSITLQKGPSPDNDPGQFVIAVARSDFYSDGNSSNDYTEYAQVFNSATAGFSGTVSQADTVRTLFPAVKARFVKITFKKAGAAIREVGVFMVQPPAQAMHLTRTHVENAPEASATPLPTNTGLAMDTGTLYPTSIQLPTETLIASPSDTQLPTETLIPQTTDTSLPTDTALPSDTATPLPTNTYPPVATVTSVPTNSLPTDTPIPLATLGTLPTDIPPTAQPLPVSTEPIIITSSNQILTFTCNGNAVEVRGHYNTVTLLGSCSSITVVGNDNQVFWQFGSPVITNKGNGNVIIQQ